MSLSVDLLESLRCDSCRSYLSVPPVHSYGEERHVCGRCPVDDAFCPVRAILYETVTAKQRFPCQYDVFGCDKKLFPGEMSAHERSCRFRSIRCLSLQCDFRGELNSFSEHYYDEHPEEVFKDIELDTVTKYTKNYVYIDGLDVFIVTISCDKVILSVRVGYLNSEKVVDNLHWQLDFLARYSKDAVHCIHGNINFYQEDLIRDDQKIAIKELLSHLNRPSSIICNLKITSYTHQKSINNNLVSEVESEVLRSLECPVCFAYMTPPIFLCSSGHNFCDRCHQQLTACPICRQGMSNTRNLMLEAMTLKVQMPCKHQTDGCSYVATGDLIGEHERKCVLAPSRCPLEDCKWQGRNVDMWEHIYEKHHDEYLDKNDITYILNDHSDNYQAYVTRKFGNLFKILFVETVTDFMWIIQLIGPGTDPSKYAFEIAICSDFNNTSIHCITDCCVFTEYHEGLFDDTTDKISICRDSLLGIFQGDSMDVDLRYRCNVFLRTRNEDFRC